MWHDIRTLNATASAISAAALLALLAGGVWWLAQRPMFTLRTITVDAIEGSALRHVNELTLRNGVAGRIKGNFFTANLEDVRALFEAVPWVRRATVRREWPNQLIVEVEEHQALGTWGDEGRLLSIKGDIFTANLAEADEDQALPELSGPDGSEKEVMARFSDLRAWFSPLKLTPQRVDLSARYAWTVKLDNGMSVALGREQDSQTLGRRVQRLVSIYPQLLARLPEGIERIDMRYPNGLALAANGLSVPSDPTKPIKPAKKKTSTSSIQQSKQSKHI